jgi:hypothetical protein
MVYLPRYNPCTYHPAQGPNNQNRAYAMNYTCKLCGQLKNSDDEQWDYCLDGVACETCLIIEEEELEK